MSKTKRDQIRGRYKAKNREYDKQYDAIVKKLENKVGIFKAVSIARLNTPSAWDEFSYIEQLKIHRGYSKNPSWWNKMFNRVPKRRGDRDKLKIIDLNTDCDDLVFSDDNKPCLYYW